MDGRCFYSQLRHRKLRGQMGAVLRGPSRFFRHGVGGLAGFGVGAGADPAGFWRRLEYAMPAELSSCGESRGCMGRPTTRRGTRADGRRDQREQRWPVVLYRRGAEA